MAYLRALQKNFAAKILQAFCSATRPRLVEQWPWPIKLQDPKIAKWTARTYRSKSHIYCNPLEYKHDLCLKPLIYVTPAASGKTAAMTGALRDLPAADPRSRQLHVQAYQPRNEASELPRTTNHKPHAEFEIQRSNWFSTFIGHETSVAFCN